jgi:hypothetical protein
VAFPAPLILEAAVEFLFEIVDVDDATLHSGSIEAVDELAARSLVEAEFGEIITDKGDIYFYPPDEDGEDNIAPDEDLDGEDLSEAD